MADKKKEGKENKQKLSLTANFLISATSSTISKTMSAPLERIKLLMQNQFVLNDLEKKYKNNFDCVKRIYQEQGIISFWRGNLANIVRYVPNFALTYSLKEFFRKHVKKTDNKLRQTLNNIFTAAVAGSLSIIVTHPLDFARTRMGVSVKKKGQKLEYKGMTDCLIQNYKLDGLRSLYSGICISIIANFFYRGLLFGLHDSKPEMNLFAEFISSSVTSSFAVTITLPFDTVKRRLMIQAGEVNKVYKGTIDCFTKIYNQEGFKGFMKGGYANIMRSFGTAFTLLFNDYVVMFFVDILHIK